MRRPTKKETKKPKTLKLVSTHTTVSAKGKVVVSDIRVKGNKVKLHRFTL